MSTDFQYDEDFSRKQEQLAKTPDMVAQRQAMHSALSLQPGERVLDVGSGNGIMVREMAETVGPGGKATGVDASEAMVDMARKLCSTFPGIEFKQANAEKLPFSDHAFDVITSAQCLCFVPGVDAALAEMHRVLRPGGRVVILDSDWGSLVWNCSNQALMDKMMSWFTGAYVDSHLPRTLSKRLTQVGFKITGRDSFAVVNWTDDPDTYAGLQIGFIEPMSEASDAISREELQEWLADLQEKSDSGEYFFSLNRYVFTAAKL